MKVSASSLDNDGTISKVTFWQNNKILLEDFAAPFEITQKNLYPGDYKIKAQAIDNRGNVSNIDSTNFRMNFADGTYSKYMHWDFNDGILDYWTLKNGTWRIKTGFQSTSGLELFSAFANCHAASSAINLKANQNYNLSLRSDGGGAPNDSIRFFINNKPEMGGKQIFAYKMSYNDDFNILRLQNFQVSQTDNYYLIIQYNKVENYTQLVFDEIRITGDLNRGAFTKLKSPSVPITVAETANMELLASALDTDGSVAAMTYYANDSLIATSNVSPFNAFWNNIKLGNYKLRAEAIDNEGGRSRSLLVDVNIEPNFIAKTDYIGNKAGSNEMRSAVFNKAGAVIFAANLDSLALPASKLSSLGTLSSTAKGYIIKMTADGSEILKAVKIAEKISDMAIDSLDNLYISAADMGLLKLKADWTVIDWSKPLVGLTAHRVDVTQKGRSVVLYSGESDINDETLTTTVNVKVFDINGTELSSMGGASQYTSDVAIDDRSGVYVVTGFKNFNSYGPIGDRRLLPVYVPVVVSRTHVGVQVYRAYDWNNDTLSLRFLNRSNNNMADVRATRCSMGKDGKLYVLYNVYGGNHVLRYDPFDVMKTAAIVAGDSYFNFANTGTETKIAFGRYNIADGSFILAQQLTNRLNVAPYKGNSIFGNGEIQADKEGNVYLSNKAASGLPMTVNHLPGTYSGGAYVSIISADFTRRLKVFRVTDGVSRALAVRNINHYAVGGFTSSQLFNANTTQTALAGQNAWFAINATDNPCPNNICVPITTSKVLQNAKVGIKSFEKIMPGNSRDYFASNTIELSPGFMASSGTIFQAKIKGCGW